MEAPPLCAHALAVLVLRTSQPEPLTHNSIPANTSIGRIGYITAHNGRGSHTNSYPRYEPLDAVTGLSIVMRPMEYTRATDNPFPKHRSDGSLRLFRTLQAIEEAYIKAPSVIELAAVPSRSKEPMEEVYVRYPSNRGD